MVSISWMAVSLMAMSQVYISGTVGLRCALCTMSASPTSPSSRIFFISRYEASKRRMKPTVTSFLPASCSASMISTHSAAVGARGFSQNTYLPALMAAITSGLWAGP